MSSAMVMSPSGFGGHRSHSGGGKRYRQYEGRSVAEIIEAACEAGVNLFEDEGTLDELVEASNAMPMDMLRQTFGQERVGAPAPYNGVSRFSLSLADIDRMFGGTNVHMSDMIIEAVLENPTWVMSEVAPTVESEKDTIKYNRIVFNKSLYGRIAEGGTSRLVTYEHMSGTDHTDRFGLAMELKSDFYTTKQGLKMYGMHKAQIEIALTQTMSFECIQGLLRCNYISAYRRRRLHDGRSHLIERLRPQLDMFGLLHKRPQAWNFLQNAVNEQLRVDAPGHKANYYILPHGSDFILNQDALNSLYLFSGHQGGAHRRDMFAEIQKTGKVKVRSSYGFPVSADEPNLDPCFREAVVGGFARMDAHTRISRVSNWTSEARNIRMYDELRDEMAVVQFADALEHAGIKRTDNAPIDRAAYTGQDSWAQRVFGADFKAGGAVATAAGGNFLAVVGATFTVAPGDYLSVKGAFDHTGKNGATRVSLAHVEEKLREPFVRDHAFGFDKCVCRRFTEESMHAGYTGGLDPVAGRPHAADMNPLITLAAKAIHRARTQAPGGGGDNVNAWVAATDDEKAEYMAIIIRENIATAIDANSKRAAGFPDADAFANAPAAAPAKAIILAAIANANTLTDGTPDMRANATVAMYEAMALFWNAVPIAAPCTAACVENSLTQVPLTGKVVHDLVEAHVPLPLTALLFRPWKRYRMGTGIAFANSEAFARTYVGHRTMDLGTDVARKLITGHYTCHFKTVIPLQNLVVTARDILAGGSLGGCGIEFFGAQDPATGQSLMFGDDLDLQRARKSIIPVVFAGEWKTVGEADDLCIDMTGKFPADLHVEVEGKELYPQAIQWNDYWGGFVNDGHVPATGSYINQMDPEQTLCFQERQDYTIGSGELYAHARRNCGHWGDVVGPGAADVRRGAAARMGRLKEDLMAS